MAGLIRPGLPGMSDAPPGSSSTIASFWLLVLSCDGAASGACATTLEAAATVAALAGVDGGVDGCTDGAASAILVAFVAPSSAGGGVMICGPETGAAAADCASD